MTEVTQADRDAAIDLDERHIIQVWNIDATAKAFAEHRARATQAQAARLAEADALLEMQNKDIERLKDALETWIFHHQRAMGEKPDVARQYARAWMFRNADGEEPE